MRISNTRLALTLAAAAALSAAPAVAQEVGLADSGAGAQLRPTPYQLVAPGKYTIIQTERIGGDVYSTTTIEIEMLSPTDVAMSISSQVSAPMRDFGGGLLDSVGGTGSIDPHTTAIDAIDRALGSISVPLQEHAGGLLGPQGGIGSFAYALSAIDRSLSRVTTPLNEYSDGLFGSAAVAGSDDEPAD